MAQGTSERGSLSSRVMRVAGLAGAATLVGGQRALAGKLDCGERSVRAWLGGEREISAGVLCDTASALEAHAADCQRQAAKLRELVDE